MSFVKEYIKQSVEICELIEIETVELMAQNIKALRDRGGRLFFIGSGGGAGHSSHAVNDLRWSGMCHHCIATHTYNNFMHWPFSE